MKGKTTYVCFMSVIQLSFIRNLLIVAIIPLCMSCFELVEDVRFNEDDSGTTKLTFNGSKSKSRIDNIMERDSMFGRPVPGKHDVVRKLQQIKNVLHEIDGIHNVQYTTDFDKYIVALSYDFDSPKAMNKAVETIQNQYEAGQLSKLPVEVLKTDQQFSRTLSEDYLKKLGKSLFRNGLFELNNAHITLMYHFSEKIKQSSVPSARISSNKTSVVIQHTLQQMLEKQQYVSITIDFL